MDSRLYEWRALPPHQPSHLLRPAARPMRVGAPQISLASAGAWKASQALGSFLLRKALPAFRGYKPLGRVVRIRMGREGSSPEGKGFWFRLLLILKGMTATDQQRVLTPYRHGDNQPFFSLPSGKNHLSSKKKRKSSQASPQQRHIISQKLPDTDNLFWSKIKCPGTLCPGKIHGVTSVGKMWAESVSRSTSASSDPGGPFGDGLSPMGV